MKMTRSPNMLWPSLVVSYHCQQSNYSNMSRLAFSVRSSVRKHSGNPPNNDHGAPTDTQGSSDWKLPKQEALVSGAMLFDC